MNDKGKDIIVKLLNSFSFKSVTLFQTKFKTSIKTNNKSVHQQSLLLNDTDITSFDEEHIYTRIPKQDSSFTSDNTLQDKTKTYSNIKSPIPTTPDESASAINFQSHSRRTTHCSQIKPFYDTSFFKDKNNFQGFFLPDECSLDLKTLQQQQSKDPVLRTVYSRLTRNEKHHSSMAFPFYMHITKDFHNYSKKTPQISLASTQQIQIPLPYIKPLLQIYYVIP